VEADRAAHEAEMQAMVEHVGQHAMAETLAAGAASEETIAAGMAASATTQGARDAEHM